MTIPHSTITNTTHITTITITAAAITATITAAATSAPTSTMLVVDMVLHLCSYALHRRVEGVLEVCLGVIEGWFIDCVKRWARRW